MIMVNPVLAASWTGDQTINGTQTYNRETINCTGNININGKLILTNSSILEMNSATDGEYSIIVNSGGELELLSGSTITASDKTKRYNLIFLPGSKGTIDGATIEYTYGDGTNSSQYGFIVKTSDLVVRDSIIQNSGSSGIIVGNTVGGPVTGVTIESSVIRNNQDDGIRVENGSQNITIFGSTIERNTNGIVISGGSFAYIHQNTLANNTDSNIVVNNANAVISNNTITGGTTGVKIENGANPVLGDLSNTDTTDDGGNTFSGQSSKAVNNQTNNIIKAANNNWGTDDPALILQLIEGPIDSSLIQDVSPPSLLITSSLDNTLLTGNSVQELAWNVSDGSGLASCVISLYYSTDGGITYSSIASALTNSSNYLWAVPNIATSQGKIKIEAKDRYNNVSTKESNANFSVQLAAQSFTDHASGLQISVPSGSSTQIPSFSVAVMDSPPGELPAGKVLASDICDITSTVNNFNQPVSCSIPIKKGFIGYSPYYWDGTSWKNDGLTVKSQGPDFMTFSTSHFSVYAILSNTQAITKPVAIPNPFDPSTENTKLTYWLDAAATTTIYIFDLTGNLIWQKRFSPTDPEGGHTNYNQVEWNGRSSYGQIVNNGLYLFTIVADGKKIGSGKIAVLK
ncbi:MAG: right-handed parallel beta-helix repeat-containing protein [bacterium]